MFTVGEVVLQLPERVLCVAVKVALPWIFLKPPRKNVIVKSVVG